LTERHNAVALYLVHWCLSASFPGQRGQADTRKNHSGF